MKSRIYEISDEEFTSLIRNSSNKAEVLFKLGYSVEGNSWAYTKLRKRMEELNLKDNDFKGNVKITQQNEKLTEEELLRENSPHSRSVVRRFIIRNNLIPYKCSICGNEGTWQGNPLSLQLDHVNGNCSDHRKENLRWLCPNCHSQTETHGSKNSAYKQYDSELETLIVEKYKKYKNQQKVSEELNISVKVIKRVLDSLGLSPATIKQSYVIRYDLNHNEIARYGSINEMCQAVIDSGETRTKLVKTCRNTFNRNKDGIWLNSYWKIISQNDIPN